VIYLLQDVSTIFERNLHKYQDEINYFVIRACTIGSIIGLLFFALMKIFNIMPGITWNGLICFSIPVVFSIMAMGTIMLLLKHRSNHILEKTLKYVLITVGSINYLCMCLFIPYIDIWGIVIIMYFLSAFYLDIKVASYGIVINSAICIAAFFIGPCANEATTSTANLVVRLQAVGFSSAFTFLSCVLSRKLLVKSSENEYDLAKSFTKIENVIAEAKETAGVLTKSGSQISELALQQKQAAETTASSSNLILDSVTCTVSSVQQTVELAASLTAGLNGMADEITSSIKKSEVLQQTANNGMAAIDNAVVMLSNIKETAILTQSSASDLDKKAKEIDNIISVIRSVAEQTNLLSLNASIEAARAGEHGRGFAVVAEEIRKLAEESRVALGEITAILTNMFSHQQAVDNLVVKIDDGVLIVNKSKQYYQDIMEELTATASSLASVNELSAKQLEYTESVNNAMDEIEQAVNNTTKSLEVTSAASEQTFASAEDLANAAKSLEDVAQKLYDTMAG
jgi:methyl-accepting chemotaxis protein